MTKSNACVTTVSSEANLGEVNETPLLLPYFAFNTLNILLCRSALIISNFTPFRRRP
jgi:hypothetical protein